MARPLRIEFAGELYHRASRGNKKEAIYLLDEDKKNFRISRIIKQHYTQEAKGKI
ncbi:hypothetical protein [Legionella clemsonensis]|uniref:Uncharacterized protein n=1 Tax=Legionella clemsonensis TaxID=1867846 RepID=A0A222P665_9GAMM|nr:hypothetical protein [Legionella clemsonensis]ASQ47297.1 hypothetical protein clem_13855 [Legionella clemsonensis]